MRVVIREIPEDVAEYTAQYIKTRINTFKPTAERPFVIGLPTGSTPIPIYAKLVEYYKTGQLSFKHVISFNMDEYVNLPANSPFSYHTFMHEHLFKHIDIDPANINILNGEAHDLTQECNNFENKIKNVGGIELFLAGLGHDGHIAFNEPGSSLSSRSRVKTLTYDTIQKNAQHFGDNIESVPRMALTVGIATILDAREVICVVTGAVKSGPELLSTVTASLT